MKEIYPLQWPEGTPRTRPQDRKIRAVWKKNERESIAELEAELKRFGGVSCAISRKDPSDFRGAADPSIVLHFSRKREEDFSWQDALGIHDPSPALEDIDAAWRKLAAKYHPDNKDTGDEEQFRAIAVHTKNARAYVNRRTGQVHDYAMGCDTYKEPKWNITALRMTIRSLRQMERDGTGALVQQAMTAFKTLGEGNHVQQPITT